MKSPEELINQISKSPTDPIKLMEYINVLDQKIEVLETMLDKQGTDSIRMIIYIQALSAMLVDKGLVTEDEFNSYLTTTSKRVSEEIANIQEDVDSNIGDIVV
jgi:hypothetical protein